MSPEAVAIELASPSGEALRVVWPAGGLAGLRRGDDPHWRLEGEIDWDEVEALRVVSAPLADGRALALASVRPAGASGHGEDPIAAVLVGKGAASPVPDPLLSIQYAADGTPQRVGVELYAGDDALPLRIAADVSESARTREAGTERVRAILDVRLDGGRTRGALEIVTAA